MEKIIHISIDATLFPLEEPAQQLLEKYLSDIRTAFTNEESAEEILRDIESRIAEHLRKLGNGPINRAHIEKIIATMGSVSELTESVGGKQTSPETPLPTDHEKATYRTHKKLYRDIEHAYLGGVCAGIAAYLDTDVTWVRVAFIALIFIGMGSIIPIYLILWLLVPPALTTADKLDMHGDPVTLQSIAANVRKRIHELKEEHHHYHEHHHTHYDHTKTSS
jgi:phage shock protein PspC (stress-responsive transcriptional regulator)